MIVTATALTVEVEGHRGLAVVDGVAAMTEDGDGTAMPIRRDHTMKRRIRRRQWTRGTLRGVTGGGTAAIETLETGTGRTDPRRRSRVRRGRVAVQEEEAAVVVVAADRNIGGSRVSRSPRTWPMEAAKARRRGNRDRHPNSRGMEGMDRRRPMERPTAQPMGR